MALAGCCSAHGGQNHCDVNLGQWICNDGTISTTCPCNEQPDPQIVNIIKRELTVSLPEYYQNHDGYREKLINEYTLRFPSLGKWQKIIPYWVYTIFPDVT